MSVPTSVRVVDPFEASGSVRARSFALVVAGVAAGLPAPCRIGLGDTPLTVGWLNLNVGDDNPDAVDRWAAWLNLPAPVMTLHPMESPVDRWFQPYEASTHRHPVTGGSVTVTTFVTVPAPTGVEGAAVVW